MHDAAAESSWNMLQAGPHGAFYQLAVELAAIETKVLLMDALRAAPLPDSEDAPPKPPAGEAALQPSCIADFSVCPRDSIRSSWSKGCSNEWALPTSFLTVL